MSRQHSIPTASDGDSLLTIAAIAVSVVAFVVVVIYAPDWWPVLSHALGSKS